MRWRRFMALPGIGRNVPTKSKSAAARRELEGLYKDASREDSDNAETYLKNPPQRRWLPEFSVRGGILK